MPKYCVAYLRYSSERQSEQSIEGQMRVCQQYADQNDLIILDTYIDRAMTGTNDSRAAFQQMLADSAKPVPWDIVLVYAIDRFGRDSIEIAVNKQRLKKNGKKYISATQRTSENIDGSKNLDGILLENVYIGLAEYYSAELSQKIRRGLHESRMKGLFSGGTIPYGYKVIDKKVCVDEDTSKVVLYIYQQYAQGRMAKDISADLADKGILYRGKPFVLNTIYHILRLEKYIGICRYDDGVFDNIYPAIIPKPLFDAVQVIVAKNKNGKRSSVMDFWLRGKLVCGYCGKMLQGDHGTSKSGKLVYYYKCMGRKKLHNCSKSTIRKDKLEKLLTDVTIKVFGNKESMDYIADEIMRVNEKKMRDKSVIALLQKDRATAQASLDNVMKAIEQGIFTPTTKNRMEELEAHIADIDDKLMIEHYKDENQLKREQVIQYFAHALKKEPMLLLQTLIQKIITYDDKLEIYYNYVEHMPTDTPPQDYSLGKGKIGCADSSQKCPPKN